MQDQRGVVDDALDDLRTLLNFQSTSDCDSDKESAAAVMTAVDASIQDDVMQVMRMPPCFVCCVCVCVCARSRICKPIDTAFRSSWIKNENLKGNRLHCTKSTINYSTLLKKM